MTQGTRGNECRDCYMDAIDKKDKTIFSIFDVGFEV